MYTKDIKFNLLMSLIVIGFSLIVIIRDHEYVFYLTLVAAVVGIGVNLRNAFKRAKPGDKDKGANV